MREVKPTQKPVPSSDIKDLFFNSGLLDIWATSLERKYIDRFGNCHLTAAGMEWIFNELVTKFKIESEQALLAAGYAPAGTFQEGAEIVSRNGTVLWKLPDGDGDYYRWDGDLPKQVPAGSTPQSTGGIGKGAWVSVGDASFRSDVRNGDGSLIGVGNNLTLKDKLSEFRTVTSFGVKGNGEDESVAMQNAIDNKIVRIPDSMRVCVSEINIKKGTEFHFGVNAELALLSVNALKFEQDTYRMVSGDVQIGQKSIDYLGNEIASSTRYIKINRPFDATDEWYIEHSENPNELGYTADIYEVKSIEGNKINLISPLTFSLNSKSYIQIIGDKDTHFFGGKITIEHTDTGRWSNSSLHASNIFFHKTKFDFSGRGGFRFDACHRVVFDGISCSKSSNGCNIMFAYGSTDSNVENSVFLGGKNADAQVIAYAGCRRIISSKNKYLVETGGSIAGLYFGAKTIGCKSIDDTVIGGQYGVIAMFGAQKFTVKRPDLQGQRDAALFLERCQMFNITNPNIVFDGTSGLESDPTWGAIVIRDCDRYSLKNRGTPISAIGRMLSIYAAAGKNGIIRKGIDINLVGTGEASLSVPMSDSSLTVKTNGKLNWYQGGNTTLNVDIVDCECSSISVSNILYSRIERNNLVGDGAGIGIDITGASSSWNEIDDNQLVNFSQGISVPSSDLCKYTNNIGINNTFRYVGVPVVIPTRSNSTPKIPYSADRPPIRGFILSVNEMLNDSAIQRTAQGFRHSGLNSAKKSDWYRVNVSETRMED
ncbi:hypothetical protein [Providencia rettgeri]|uniref:tail fiber/spike domain-containing protein n=1 Tax=Providencia rettgeri TaxID=587 RepID=UPI0016581B00|nr:hypothetical protein [Providencia rettgeri]QNP19185.1 hypothetical protein H9L31_14970 [Providencia rettgeri]